MSALDRLSGRTTFADWGALVGSLETLATVTDEHRDRERRYAALASESRILRAEGPSGRSEPGGGAIPDEL